MSRIVALLTFLVLAFTLTIGTAEARRQSKVDANGNVSGPCVVKSGKTGATARVGCAHVAEFQAYVDDLESNHGATIHRMGGIRPGGCRSNSLHPCGKALDLCQLSRGRVESRCHLPGRESIAAVASRHGLFEGGQWCNHDYGHAQVGVTAGACGTHTMMARTHKRHRRGTVETASAFVPPDRLIAH